MNIWRNKIEKFYNNLSQENGLHSVKDLCKIFLEDPHASFWENKNESEVVEYIKDWLDVSESKLSFHKKWIGMLNMNNIINYDEQEIGRTKELLDLLDQS
jgi:hypothetical protein